MLHRTQKTVLLDSAAYRASMSKMAGAVSIVSTDGSAGIRGVTVSAVVSVSDNPPTMLVCLNQNREENRFFKRNGCFAISTLCAVQAPLARAFAGEADMTMQQRFALGHWRILQSGAPVLVGARMSLDCIITDVQSIHTHFVIIGEVVAKGETRDEPALIFLERGYREIGGGEASKL